MSARYKTLVWNKGLKAFVQLSEINGMLCSHTEP